MRLKFDITMEMTIITDMNDNKTKGLKGKDQHQSAHGSSQGHYIYQTWTFCCNINGRLSGVSLLGCTTPFHSFVRPRCVCQRQKILDIVNREEDIKGMLGEESHPVK
jgi:hypothetical protein